MCGIFAIYHPNGTVKFSAAKARELSARQRHRGPDFNGLYQHPVNGNILAHERLAIMDLSCVQPLQGASEEHQVVHNGEIYNWRALRDGMLSELPYRTTCDSEAIIKLYEKLHEEPEFEHQLCLELDGVFSFALIYGDEFMAARDPIGVKPLYWGTDAQGRWMFSSEMKVIEDNCLEVCAFPPGHFYTPAKGFVRYYEPDWFRWELATGDMDLPALRNSLISATEKRLKSDAPIGVLLSGGLDSSLISAISVRALRDCSDHALRSFSIGLDAQAPDVVAARKIAAFLGTEHHEFTFSVEEGIEVIDQLIWHLETYDVTSVRASTPMFFLSRKITEMGIKVVLSGEGSDEIFGGYLYFHNAPDDAEYQKETIRRVNLLSTADCLRADKSTMANSLEVRVPFLDKQFLALAMGMAPAHKRPKPEPGQNGGRPVEKWVLRKAFQDEADPLLPDEILWRQKEQFSDGVGYGWIDQLIDHCSAQISDEEMATAPSVFPHNTPTTKEAFYIRKIFHKHFPSDGAARTVLKWVPKWQESEDPSGRANTMHENAKKEGESDQKTEADQKEETDQKKESVQKPEADQEEGDQEQEADQKRENDEKMEKIDQPESDQKEDEKQEADQKEETDQKKEKDREEESDQKLEGDQKRKSDQKPEDYQKRENDREEESDQKQEDDQKKENSKQDGETAHQDEDDRMKEHDRKEERDQQPEDQKKESGQKPEADQKRENDQKEQSDREEKDDQKREDDQEPEADHKEIDQKENDQRTERDQLETDQKKENDQKPEEDQKEGSDQKSEHGNQKIEIGQQEEIEQDDDDRQKENDQEVNGEQEEEEEREEERGEEEERDQKPEDDQKKEDDQKPENEQKGESDPKKENDQEKKNDQRKGSDQKERSDLKGETDQPEEKVIRPNGRCQLL